MEERFGKENVCTVRTYSALKLKGAIKDLARNYGVDFKEANLVTAIIDDGDKSMTDLFKRAVCEPKLRRFIRDNPSVVYDLPLVLNQPKAKSLHACSLVIYPRN